MNAVLAGLLGALVAFAFAHGRHTPYDNYVLLADAMLHGRLWIDPLWPGPSIDAVVFQGHRYIVNDPVPALFLLPVVALFGVAANQTLIACLLCGLAVGAAWLLLERLGVSTERTIWLVAFVLAGTDVLWCSMLGDVWFVAQTSAVAFVLLALCELAGKRRGWLVALFAALALGSRFTLVMALPVLAVWVYAGFLEPERRLRSLLAFGARAACRSSCCGSPTTKRAGMFRGMPDTRFSSIRIRSWVQPPVRRSRCSTFLTNCTHFSCCRRRCNGPRRISCRRSPGPRCGSRALR